MACFFGFGSLVNTATHKYVAITPARISGWSRVWVNNDLYDHAFLSVVPSANCSIQGLMAEVPGDDWLELDLREVGYSRRVLAAADWCLEITEEGGPLTVDVAAQTLQDVQMYQDVAGKPATQGGKSILWSYLETVLYGYYQWFGAHGVHRFIDSTDSWVNILDDRMSPQYPRYVPAKGAAVKAVIPAMDNLYR